MGKMEEVSRRRSRRAYIERALLSSLAVAGLLGIALIAPNVLGALKKLGFLPKGKFGNRLNRTRNRLLRDGYITFEETKRGTFLRLTPKGEVRFRRLELSNFALPKPKKWDGKYRMVIFDIKEARRRTRDQIRDALRNIGFLRLQNSVWVYPYDCEDVTIFLKADYKIGKEVLYLIVDSIENDKHIRVHFGLPKA